MNQLLPDGSEERVGGGDVRAVYVDTFADHSTTLQFARAALKRTHQKGENYFEFPSLEAQYSVLDATGPARAPGDVADAVVGDDFVGTMLDVEDDRDLKS